MSRATGLSRQGRLTSAWVALVLAACNHTAPFVTGFYRATGPFAEIAGEEQLTVGGVSFGAWSSDGARILSLTSGSGCFNALPAAGGSGLWFHCNAGGGYSAAALDGHGRIVFQIWNAGLPLFPVRGQADFWVVDTTRPYSLIHKLLTLYRDTVGLAVVSPTTVNWIAQSSWMGPDTFVVVGQNLKPNGTFTTLGVYRGVIRDTAELTGPLSGTAGKAHYGFADGGHTVVFSDSGSLVLWKASFDDIQPSEMIATIPHDSDRSIVDLSCGGNRCVVLTDELVLGRVPAQNHVGATLWELDLATGAVTSRFEFPGTGVLKALPNTVSVSPISGDVVVMQGASWIDDPHSRPAWVGGELYLLPGVLPD